MKQIWKLVTACFFSAALLTGCSGSDSEVVDTEAERETLTESSNERVPIDRNPSDPNVRPDDTTDNVTTRNIGGTATVPSNTIMENASATPELSTLMGAIKQAGLVATLNRTGPYTLFAPSNEAFEALPGGTLEDLLKPENKAQLVNLLNNHIVAGKLNANSLRSGSTIKTAGNGQLKAANQGSAITVNGASVSTPDIVSSNGVIHIVDKVMVPDSK